MLSSFEKKRLDYFIKAAKKREWVQLGEVDLHLLNLIKEININEEKELEMELAQYQIKIDK